MYYEIFEKLCEAKNVKPGRVSAETGISTATLTSWKQGKYTPKQEKLQILADYFGVSLMQMMGKEEDIDGVDYYLAGEELELILEYRAMNDKQKNRLLEYAELLRMMK